MWRRMLDRRLVSILRGRLCPSSITSHTIPDTTLRVTHASRPRPSPPLPLSHSWISPIATRRSYATGAGGRLRRSRLVSFLSWLFVGHGVALFVGTTSVVSVYVLVAHGLQVQDFLLRRLARYLQGTTGVDVQFQGPVTPDWRQGRLVFKDVLVSKGQQTGQSSIGHHRLDSSMMMPIVEGQGQKHMETPTTTSFDHAHMGNQEGAANHISKGDVDHISKEDVDHISKEDVDHISKEDPSDSYTRFRLCIERVEASLSVWRWLCGRGLVETGSVSGIRGVVDRSHLQWGAPPHRYAAHWGDFDVEQVTLRDALVQVENGDRAPSYTLSVYQAQLPRLRKSWLLYDLLSADGVVGMFDNSLFTYQRPQKQQAAELQQHLRHLKIDNVRSQHYTGLRAPLWRLIRRGSIDLDAFVRLDILMTHPNASSGANSGGNNSGEQSKDRQVEEPAGLFQGERVRRLLMRLFEESWQQEDYGSSLLFFPLDLPIMPLSTEKDSASSVVHASPIVAFARKLRSFVVKAPIPEKGGRGDGVETDKEEGQLRSAASQFQSARSSELAFKVSLRLRNIRAAAPSPTDSTSLWDRHIVAFLNEGRPFINVDCSFVMSRERFQGSWTLYDSGLTATLAEAVSAELDRQASDRSRQLHRLRRVGWWSVHSLVKQLHLLSSFDGSFLFDQFAFLDHA
jgi:distribution and morphology protein 31